MAEDLTPKIVHTYDSAQFLDGGRVREVTVVRFMIGRFGPYEHTFDRGPSTQTIRDVMNDRKRAIEDLV